MVMQGAAMNQDILAIVSPSIVLVEEAAEILEPQLMAVLSSNVQHLILVGDHKQLRPSVQSYHLETRHNLGISMLERLAENSKLPFQTLGFQSRMREEFLQMVRPIYPNLRSNTEVVCGVRNLPTNCMASTMYFWNHSFKETAGRSPTNEREAHMVVALTKWLLSEGHMPGEITVICPYNEQVSRVRSMLDKTRGEEETAIDVQTIDRFQGSENRIIIASLVRSNPEGNIGHLFAQNRLCVTVSRARSGLYLCGNAETLSQKSPHWKTLIDECFRSQNYLGERIFLTCPRHPHDLSIPLHHKDAQNFSPNVCDRPCKALLACGHHCINTCHYGEHGLCKVEVPYIFEKCKHSTTTLCSESDTSLKCLEEVWITLETCGHTQKCMCWEKNEKVSSALACTFPCGKTLVCEHPCTLFCSQECGSKPCPKCAEIERVKAQKEKELLLKQIKEKTSIIDGGEIEKLKSEPRVGPSFKDLLPDGETAAEYRMVQDRTEKFIQPTHETLPVVTRIEKVTNLKLQLQFLQAQRALTDVLAPSQLLFYGTDDEGVKSITSKGFQLRRASKNNMFGTGCYFAIDSSKSAHQLYTKGSNKLLLCEVLLGRPWSLNSAKPDLNFGLVQSKMYDSVFSMRNGVESGETEYDDYIIYKPSQAIPRYVVHYKNLDCSASELQSLCENKADRKFERRVLNASASSYNGVTSDELHFRFAEAQFLRMSNKGRQQVEKVEYTWNEELHERYQKRKQQLEAEEKPVDEKLVFHGTKKENIEKIIREGFKVGGEGVAIRCGAVYGNGVYTAANPEISMPYSSGSGMMLLSVALCGKLNEDYSLGASADIYVVKKGDQLLPRYIVHFRSKRNSAPPY